MPFSFKPQIPKEETGGWTFMSLFKSSSSSVESLIERPGQGMSFIIVLLSIVCGGAALLSVGLIGYSYYLNKAIKAKEGTLQEYETALGTLPLGEMRALSARIKLINQLLAAHASANTAFKILESSVENQIIYKSFKLNINPANTLYSLSLMGTASDYKALIQQVETLKRKPYSNYISNVKVENVSPDDLGQVQFSLLMSINLAGISPEELNLSDGVASLFASSTPKTQAVKSATTTPTASSQTATSTASSTPKAPGNASSTPSGATSTAQIIKR